MTDTLDVVSRGFFSTGPGFLLVSSSSSLPARLNMPETDAPIVETDAPIESEVDPAELIAKPVIGDPLTLVTAVRSKTKTAEIPEYFIARRPYETAGSIGRKFPKRGKVSMETNNIW